MSTCIGCFPFYQDNQTAHMEVGGCLHVDDMEFCQPVNLGPIFDRIAEEDRVRILAIMQAQAEQAQVQAEQAQQNATVYTNDDECVICYEEIGKTNNCVTPCGHAFCFKCLVSSMTIKNTCPCCRAELFVLPNDDDYESGSENGSESGSESESESESDDDNDEMVPVETLVTRLESRGFTMLDVVSMLSGNYSKTNPKYTNEFIVNMNKTYDDVIVEIENEHDEQRKFAEEDTRTRESNRV